MIQTVVRHMPAGPGLTQARGKYKDLKIVGTQYIHIPDESYSSYLGGVVNNIASGFHDFLTSQAVHLDHVNHLGGAMEHGTTEYSFEKEMRAFFQSNSLVQSTPTYHHPDPGQLERFQNPSAIGDGLDIAINAEVLPSDSRKFMDNGMICYGMVSAGFYLKLTSLIVEFDS